MSKKLIRKGVKIEGAHSIHYGTVKCAACGGDIPSQDEACPHCGASRKTQYDVNEIKVGEKVTDRQDIAKAEQGAHNCQYCGDLTWNYSEKDQGYVCDKCGGKTRPGGPSEYELAGGQSDPTPLPVYESTNSLPDAPTPGLPLWAKIAIGVGGAVILIVLVWFLAGLFTTKSVHGTVSQVYWERHASQEENQLLTGEGWNLPSNATPQGTPESRFSHNQDNIVDYTRREYYVTSTPEVDYYEYGEVTLETPGAITTSEPYDCGSPTPEPGGFVSYDQCYDEYQEDSTYVTVEDTENPTPVYKDSVDIRVTSQPTPVYGTPTPIFKDYWRYTYWQWVKLFDLDPASGNNNDPVWPQGQMDATHRVVNGQQLYRVVITFDNGYVKTLESSDPGLLVKYLQGMDITGHFNNYGGLNSYEP